MLNKFDYVNILRVLQVAKADGLEQAQLLVNLAQKVNDHAVQLQADEDKAKLEAAKKAEQDAKVVE